MTSGGFPVKSTDAPRYNKRLALSEAQNHRCAYCGIRFSDDLRSDAYGTIDEVVPRAAGGTRMWENQVMACALCNEGRGAGVAHNYFDFVWAKGRSAAYQWSVSRQKRKLQECGKPDHRNRPAGNRAGLLT